jgi:hypothetical protein
MEMEADTDFFEGDGTPAEAAARWRAERLADLERRQAEEWRQVVALQAEGRARRARARAMRRQAPADVAEMLADAASIAHAQRLQLDPAARLGETELQRRRRYARRPGAAPAAAGAHTAEFSHAAPATPARWLDKVPRGGPGGTGDGRGLTTAEVDRWRRHTKYNGLSSTDPTVRWFWELVGEWDPARRGRILQLATGTACAPRGGFGALMGRSIGRPDFFCPFSLRSAAPGDADDRRVRAFAPLNRLYLPLCHSKMELALLIQAALVRAFLEDPDPPPTDAATTTAAPPPPPSERLQRCLEGRLRGGRGEAAPAYLFTIDEENG